MEMFGDAQGLALVRLYIAAGETLDDPDASQEALERAHAVRTNLLAAADTWRIADAITARITGGDVVRFLGQLVPLLVGADDADDADDETA